MPAADTQGPKRKRKSKSKAPAYKPVRGDAPVTRKVLRSVEEFKRTSPTYRSAVRTAYSNRGQTVPASGIVPRGGVGPPTPVAVRADPNVEARRGRALAALLGVRGANYATAINGRPVLARPEDDAIAELRAQRRSRGRELERSRALHDIITEGDRRVAQRYYTTTDEGRRDAGRIAALRADTAASRPVQPGDTSTPGQRATAGKKRKEAEEDDRVKVAFRSGAISEQEATDALNALEGERKAFALTALEQLTRLSSAAAGATRAVTEGKGPVGALRGYGEGFYDNDDSFGKLLRDKGVASGWKAGALGLALDVALDPTTYLTLGAGTAARGAVKAAEPLTLGVGAREAHDLAKRVYDGTVTRDELLELGADDALADTILKNAGRTRRGVRVGVSGTPVRAVSAARALTDRGVRAKMRTGAKDATTASLRAPVTRPDAKVRSAAAKGVWAATLPARVATAPARGAMHALTKNSRREIGTTGYGSSRVLSRVLGERDWTPTVKAVGVGPFAHKVREGALDEIGREALFAYRPKGMHPLDFDLVRSAGRKFRATTGAGDRAAVAYGRALRGMLARLGVDEGSPEFERIVYAVDAGDVSRLSGAEREIAEKIERDMASMFDAEVEAGARTADQAVGQRAAPDVPAVTADVETATDAHKAARKERFAAEREELAAREQFGRTAEAAEDLGASLRRDPDVPMSRNAGEMNRARGDVRRVVEPLKRAAARRERSTGRPRDVLRFIDDVERIEVPAGGVGVRAALLRLEEATERVQAARKAEVAAERAAKRERKAAADQRKARTQAQREADAGADEAAGYYPRAPLMLVKDRKPGARPTNEALTAQGNPMSLSSSQRKRRDRRSFDVMREAGDDAITRYDTETVAPLVNRMVESGRQIARARMLEDLAPLARTIASVDEAAEEGLLTPVMRRDIEGDAVRDATVDVVRVMADDGSLKPLFRAVDTEGQRRAKLAAALEGGQDVVAFGADLLRVADEQASRGRPAAGVSTAGRAFDRLSGGLKWWLTQPNPGYHVTNLIGDLYNARVGGVASSDLAAALRMMGARKESMWLMDDLARDVRAVPQARDLVRQGRTEYYEGVGGSLTDAQVFVLALEHGGVLTGFSSKELRDMLDVTSRAARGKRTPGSVIAAISEAREDLFRLASFHRALKQGKSPDEAAAHVARHHFDYGDLTNLERTFMRRVVPFYVFASRNFPLQVKSLATSPGRPATAEKTRDESARSAGLDPDWVDAHPRYQQAGLPFVSPQTMDGLPVGVAPKLPVMDLSMIPMPGSGVSIGRQMADELVARATPFGKLPVEFYTDKDLFLRADRRPTQRVGAPSWAEGLEVLVSDKFVEPIYDRRTGDLVPGWNWKTGKLLSTIPLVGAAAAATTEGRDRYSGSKEMTVTNYLTGPRRFVIDPRQARRAQIFDEMTRLENARADFKDGLPLKQQTEEGGDKHPRLDEFDDQLDALKRELYDLDTGEGYDDPRGKPPKKGRRSAGLWGGGSSNPWAGGGGRLW